MSQRWSYKDATGVQREGFFEKFLDHGGTDIIYFFHRDDKTLDLVSGPRLKYAKNIQAEYLTRTAK